MKDFISQDVQVGEYFAYPIKHGNSTNIGVYSLHSIIDSTRVKALKVKSSCSYDECGVKLSILNEFSRKAIKVNYIPT
jgi:hypothetical protein